MTALTAPNSSAVADIPEDQVERYEQAGWVRVEKPKQTAKKKSDEK